MASRAPSALARDLRALSRVLDHFVPVNPPNHEDEQRGNKGVAERHSGVQAHKTAAPVADGEVGKRHLAEPRANHSNVEDGARETKRHRDLLEEDCKVHEEEREDERHAGVLEQVEDLRVVGEDLGELAREDERESRHHHEAERGDGGANDDSAPRSLDLARPDLRGQTDARAESQGANHREGDPENAVRGVEDRHVQAAELRCEDADHGHAPKVRRRAHRRGHEEAQVLEHALARDAVPGPAGPAQL
mmetsp:Transcript_24746/g.69904  ORF Transcript_24746/g.69904 Transcript_24746/m.69904 type:complete len:248 (+) Transcript_24746:2989-3732(+)